MISSTLFILLLLSNFAICEVNGTNVYSRFIHNLCTKIGISKSTSCCWLDKTVTFVGFTLLAVIVAFVVIPLLCCICRSRPTKAREDSHAAPYQPVRGAKKKPSCLQSVMMSSIFKWIIVIASTTLVVVIMYYYGKKCS